MRLIPLLFSLLLPGSLLALNLAEEQRLSEQLIGADLQGEAQWLTAGDIRFLAILTKTSSDERLGGAILLHDAEDNADGPDVIAPLRRHLALRGWDTLSLQLPRPSPPTAPAERRAAVALAPARLQAAVEFLKQRQASSLVLVGHGLGAEMALAYEDGSPDTAVTALVAIGLSAGTGGDDDPLIQTIAELRHPMLDLYGDREDEQMITSAMARRGTAKRIGQAGYRQDRVVGADHRFSGLQTSLQQRVTSWLRRVAEASRSDNP
jgi:pimeloyl-ACP methyl ester carboxylesterase